MSSLKDRLGRLERASATRLTNMRCANCRDWPRARIVTIDTDGNQAWTKPVVPASCPQCGWTPVEVTIHEVDDWGSVQRVKS
jgi:hypothetical protein